jgi:hypothetical protein
MHNNSPVHPKWKQLVLGLAMTIIVAKPLESLRLMLGTDNSYAQFRKGKWNDYKSKLFIVTLMHSAFILL